MSKHVNFRALRCRRQLRFGAVDGPGFDVRQHRMQAVGNGGFRQRQADAGSAAGDDGNAAGQRSQVRVGVLDRIARLFGHRHLLLLLFQFAPSLRPERRVAQSSLLRQDS